MNDLTLILLIALLAVALVLQLRKRNRRHKPLDVIAVGSAAAHPLGNVEPAPRTTMSAWPIDTGLEYGPHFDMTPIEEI